MPLDDAGRRSAQGALDWIAEHWPALAARIPPGCPLFDLGFGIGKGCCTGPEALKDAWFPSLGGEVFAFDRDVPDPFFACGLQNRGGSEYLFAMRREGPRRFWFYDQYVVFVAQTDASPERTAEFLDAALEFWDKGGETVVFSGPWGWFDPAKRAFGSLNEIQKALYKLNRDLDPLPPQTAPAANPRPGDPPQESAAAVPPGKFRVLVTCTFMSPHCGPDETQVGGDFESLEEALAHVERCARQPSSGGACFSYKVLDDRGKIVASRPA